ncbi:MAG: 30S ribosomal protein S6 [Candidatus Aureabacteria bacterium]|nr:30S ribosomal protein S6 [Candidatus Auribacterota bacterium]
MRKRGMALKSYEVMLILKPELPDDQAAKAMEGIAGEITKLGGQVAPYTMPPKGRLAYRVAKHDDGYCVCLKFQLLPSALVSFKERLRMNTDVLRDLITVSK